MNFGISYQIRRGLYLGLKAMQTALVCKTVPFMHRCFPIPVSCPVHFARCQSTVGSNTFLNFCHARSCAIQADIYARSCPIQAAIYARSCAIQAAICGAQKNSTAC